MLRFFYALREASQGSGSREVVDARLHDYDEVLYEWNDRLNVNLALVGTYFGETARDWLEDEVYRSYQQVGRMLEELHRSTEGPPVPSISAVEAEILALNDRVYRLGVFMMTQLRRGSVGNSAPRPVSPSNTPRDVHGRAVPIGWTLARCMNDAAGKADRRLRCLETERAISRGIRPRGLTGPFGDRPIGHKAIAPPGLYGAWQVGPEAAHAPCIDSGRGRAALQAVEVTSAYRVWQDGVAWPTVTAGGRLY